MADKPRWALNDDEWRLLVITFVGGLASIIVGAAMLGGALALARYEERTGSLTGLAFSTTVSLPLCVTPFLLVVAPARPDSRWQRLTARGLKLAITTSATLLFCYLALAWIGVAVQVK